MHLSDSQAFRTRLLLFAFWIRIEYKIWNQAESVFNNLIRKAKFRGLKPTLQYYRVKTPPSLFPGHP